MNETRIKSCTCQSSYQDKKYGKGQRVQILKQKSKGRPPQDWTCTVCGKVHRD